MQNSQENPITHVTVKGLLDKEDVKFNQNFYED